MIERSVRIKVTKVRRQKVTVSKEPFRARCAECERDVDLVARSQAAHILELDLLQMEELIASGQIHAIQTVSGGIRVCKDSLFAR